MYHFNQQTDEPLGSYSNPGSDKTTSRCRTLPSICTIGGDQPVIPSVPSFDVNNYFILRLFGPYDKYFIFNLIKTKNFLINLLIYTIRQLAYAVKLTRSLFKVSAQRAISTHCDTFSRVTSPVKLPLLNFFNLRILLNIFLFFFTKKILYFFNIYIYIII